MVRSSEDAAFPRFASPLFFSTRVINNRPIREQEQWTSYWEDRYLLSQQKWNPIFSSQEGATRTIFHRKDVFTWLKKKRGWKKKAPDRLHTAEDEKHSVVFYAIFSTGKCPQCRTDSSRSSCGWLPRGNRSTALSSNIAANFAYSKSSLNIWGVRASLELRFKEMASACTLSSEIFYCSQFIFPVRLNYGPAF